MLLLRLLSLKFTRRPAMISNFDLWVELKKASFPTSDLMKSFEDVPVRLNEDSNTRIIDQFKCIKCMNHYMS